MKIKGIWVFFLLLVFAFAIWFVVNAGFSLINYYKLSVQVPIEIEEWEVKEFKGSDYAIVAHFSYAYDEKEYKGQERLKRLYPNPWAAKRALGLMEKEVWHGWINPRAPETIVLEKSFPYKGSISAAVLIGLCAYFIGLGLYVGLKDEKKRS